VYGITDYYYICVFVILRGFLGAVAVLTFTVDYTKHCALKFMSSWARFLTPENMFVSGQLVLLPSVGLVLLPSVGLEMSTSQSAVMLCGLESKAGWLIPFVEKWQVKLWSLLTRAIISALEMSLLVTKRYANVLF